MAELHEMSDAQLERTSNDDIRSSMTTAGIAFEGDDNKSDLIGKIRAHYAANPPATTTPPPAGDWGTMTAATLPPEAGNGGGGEIAGSTRTLPPSPTIPGETPQGDGPGQGRVEQPSSAVVPADAPAGAVPQAQDGTPRHHDASTAGSGPGGTAPNAEVAERTGAPIAEAVNEAGEEITPPERIPASAEHTNRLARRDIGAEFDPSERARAARGEPSLLPRTDDSIPDEVPALGAAVGDGSTPQFTDMLRSSLQIDSRLKAATAPASVPGAVQLPETNEQLIVPDGVNEKITDAIGSTHDAAGNPIVKAADPSATPPPDGSGQPVFVGTAQPVERPEAAWRSNTAT